MRQELVTAYWNSLVITCLQLWDNLSMFMCVEVHLRLVKVIIFIKVSHTNQYSYHLSPYLALMHLYSKYSYKIYK